MQRLGDEQLADLRSVAVGSVDELNALIGVGWRPIHSRAGEPSATEPDPP